MTDTSIVNSGDDTSDDKTPEAEVKDEAALAAEAKAEEGEEKTPEAEAEGDPNKENAEGKKADGEADDDEPEGAPEKYEDFTVPEGIEVDPKEVEAFTGLAKEFKLSQADAQKLIDFEAERVQRMASQQAELWDKTRGEWVEQSKADKRFGGKAFDENVGLAHQALKKFGSPELATLCDEFGIGDNPEFINLLVNVGKAMKEDGLETGRGSSAGDKPDIAKRLFPSMN